MKLQNTFRLPVPVDEAWRLLLAVERVVPCIPGAVLDSVDGEELSGRVKVKLGPITVAYKGKARFTSVDESSRAVVLKAVGTETRGNGRVSAAMAMRLVDRGEETECAVTTDLTVTGKPAQFGRGMMAEVSSKLVDQFAECLAETARPKSGAPAIALDQARVEVPRSGIGEPLRGPEAIDLIGSAGLPALKRVLPVLVLVVVAWFGIAALRRR